MITRMARGHGHGPMGNNTWAHLNLEAPKVRAPMFGLMATNILENF
jgi:hypothetical protein